MPATSSASRYLGLQAHLLVQADLEVGQHDQLRSPLGIRLEELPLVAHEGLPQVLLAVGRRAGPQSGEEAPGTRASPAGSSGPTHCSR